MGERFVSVGFLGLLVGLIILNLPDQAKIVADFVNRAINFLGFVFNTFSRGLQIIG